MSLAGLLTVSLTVAFPTFVFPNKTKLKSLEAEVGIGRLMLVKRLKNMLFLQQTQELLHCSDEQLLTSLMANMT
jgi:hypothetical protein